MLQEENETLLEKVCSLTTNKVGVFLMLCDIELIVMPGYIPAKTSGGKTPRSGG